MEADFAVELGADDETLEFPWQDPEGSCHYFDLKSSPELLAQVPEACQYPELGEFLLAINSATGVLETAKCDVWQTSDMTVEDEIFGAKLKFASYVDLLFRSGRRRFSLPDHQVFAQFTTSTLKMARENGVAAEIVLRRCYYHEAGQVGEGFYFTVYVFGYGEAVADARQRWSAGLQCLQRTIRRSLG